MELEGRHAVKYGFTADTYRGDVYIASRAGICADMFRGGVDRASRLEMACTMIYLITGQQVSIVSHRDAPTLAWKLGIFDLLKLENGVIIKERNLKSSPRKYE